MAELKTKKNNASVKTFIAAVENETRRKDSEVLLKLFEEVTGEKAMMWGTSIIGFGEYHYKHERSTQEGDWPLTGFSPRKTSLSIYIMPGFKKYQKLLDELGKHKHSVSCLYINKLADVDLTVLKKLIKVGYEDMKKGNTSCG
jgi:hypothetical protein